MTSERDELARIAANAAAYKALIDDIARAFHEAYERKAPDLGYRTRAESRVPWADVPHANKVLMRATVAELLSSGVIRGGRAGLELRVVEVDLGPEHARAVELAKAAVERDRAALDPFVRQLVEALEPELERALEELVLGVPSDGPPTLRRA